MLRGLTLALILLSAPASAERWRAAYAITAAGITIMEADVTFRLGEDGGPYSIETRLRARGLAAFVLRGESLARSEGLWRGSLPRPWLHESGGNWRGTPRRTRLDYGADGNPRITTLMPSQDMERAPLADGMLDGTVDSLSALVGLIGQVRRTARCEARARSFDGRRVTQFEVTTDPIVHASDRGLLRCLVESRPLAGYALDRPVAEATRPTQSVLVFGVALPGAPAIPVRIEVASRWWGTIQATLNELTSVD